MLLANDNATKGDSGKMERNNEIESLTIWAVSNDYYATKVKNCLSVYGYDHQLINFNKPIKNVVNSVFF